MAVAPSLFFALLLASFLLSALALPTIFVSTQGDDTWTGDSATHQGGLIGPVRTIPKAIELSRTLYNTTQRRQISVAAGYYTLDATLQLTAQDSNLELVAEDTTKQATVISGGKPIPANAFKPLGSTGLASRIPSAARSNVVTVDLLTTLNLTIADLGTWAPKAVAMELFFREEDITIARYPNPINWDLIADVSNPDGVTFTYNDTRIESWGGYTDVWLHGFFFYDWQDDRVGLVSVNTVNKVLTISQNPSYGLLAGQRYFYWNVIDELDISGEYYIDHSSGILYFWPPSPIETDSDAVVSLLNTDLITVYNAHDVLIKGFTFEATRARGIYINGGNNVEVTDCTFRNIGSVGVAIDRGFNHLVQRSEIYNIGTTAVNIYGGERNNLTSCNHLVFNNHIHNFAKWEYCYRPGVNAGGVGIKIINNEIHDAPHEAINLPPANNVEIYFNEIYDVTKITSDVGAFYQGRDWASRGTFISYNYFHDINGVEGYGASAIYFDDENSGSTAYGNIMISLERGVLIGGGRDNHVLNNIFVMNTRTAYSQDARGLTSIPGNNDTLFSRLFSVPYTQPPWSTEYPELVNILTDPPSPHAPKNNWVQHNVACNCTRFGSIASEARNFSDPVTYDNWVDASANCLNSIFTDYYNGDLSIRPDAPFYNNITFTWIPWPRMGRKGAYYPLPSYLPGLKYGNITTPADPNGSQSSGASRLSNTVLDYVLSVLL